MDSADGTSYVVVARRYRPQRFTELVGQEHVGRSLANAIAAGRVGHAYLFTGARGVGKTSTARILAKCLNCRKGPTAEPCNECDICEGISGGGDVDVLEIDGASNRGIDEIRQLRQNVGIRPSRSRYKIYIIDEVHMLTKEAFNALLKTLEEPPEHVKFIFCTTEPEKVPVTVLSRCQRFDFAGIQAAEIVARLAEIVKAEGVSAEPQALEIIARRAAGSMRDSQSLLEQLLAFGGKTLTVADVHGLLGTADWGRMAALLSGLLARDVTATLAALDAALAEGCDVGQLMDQLMGVLRDVMVAALSGSPEQYLYCLPSESELIQRAGKAAGLETTLAMLQIVEQALARMRTSTHRRTLAELALVRMCHLEAMADVSGLIEQLRAAAPCAPSAGSMKAPTPAVASETPAAKAAAVKKNDSGAVTAVPDTLSASTPHPNPLPQGGRGLERSPPTHGGRGVEREPAAPALAVADPEGETMGAPSLDAAAPRRFEPTPDELLKIWQQAVADVAGLSSSLAGQCSGVVLEPGGRLVVRFRGEFARSHCERSDRKAEIERALSDLTGQAIRLELALDAGADTAAACAPRPVSKRERLDAAGQNPLISRAKELFGARVVDLDEPS
ncbi:MAG: DNA polymerase III subunit gamma/tau [Planctomycetia bacterium]|nr:DNA polymerase III subunit gamma/tau [Planctomycetia bacterium]